MRKHLWQDFLISKKGLRLAKFFDWDLRGILRKDGYAMMTVEEMKAVDIRTVDRDTLVDIRDGLLYWDYNDSIKASNKILV